MNSWLKITALVSGLAAVIVIVFYLITLYPNSIYFTEPNPWIRNIEIVLGIATIPLMIRMIFEELYNLGEGQLNSKEISHQEASKTPKNTILL